MIELHLLEYHRRKLAYLKAVQCKHTKVTGTAGLTNFGITTNTLKPFLAPDDLQGYADKSISHEVITEVFLDFSSCTWQAESQLYLRSLPSKFVLICWARPLIVLHATSSVWIHR